MSFAANKILLLFFCVLFLNSTAQNEFHTFTKSDGLTSSNILFTKVDHKGVIWAATNSGINAFTGGKWVPIKSITNHNGNKTNMGRVTRIFETIVGEMWIVTEKGLFIYNGSYWTLFYDRDNDGFVVADIFEDRRGWIWILLEKERSIKDISDIGFAFVEGKIQMFNGQLWHTFPDKIGGSAAVTIGDPMEYFTSHLQDEQGNIWITNLDGLYKFDGKKWTNFNKEQLPSDICNKVIESSDNEIWVATRHGIAKQVGNKWVKYEKNRGIKENNVSDLLEDNKQRLWAIVKKDNRFSSLCVYKNDSWKPYFKDNIKIKGNISQLFDFDNQLIAFSKKGLSFFDGNNWTCFVKKYGITDDDFSNFIITKNKTLWFAGQKSLYKLKSDSLQVVYSPEKSWKATSIFESSKSEIWVGTEKNGVYLIVDNEIKNYKINNGLEDNYIKEVFEDKQKNIWVVTKWGISRFE